MPRRSQRCAVAGGPDSAVLVEVPRSTDGGHQKSRGPSPHGSCRLRSAASRRQLAHAGRSSRADDDAPMGERAFSCNFHLETGSVSGPRRGGARASRRLNSMWCLRGRSNRSMAANPASALSGADRRGSSGPAPRPPALPAEHAPTCRARRSPPPGAADRPRRRHRRSIVAARPGEAPRIPTAVTSLRASVRVSIVLGAPARPM